MKRFLQILTIFCLGVHLVYSQESNSWTLRQCIDYAIENNIEIKQLAIQVEQAEIDLNTTKNSRLPNLNSSISPGFNVGQTPVKQYNETDNVWYEVYENTQATTTSLSVSTSIPVFSGMRINKQVKSEKFSLIAATESLNKARENIEIQVASLFLEVLYKKDMLTIYSEQVKLAIDFVERSNVLLEAGKVTKYEILEAQSQLVIAESNMVSAENAFNQALLELAHTLNITDVKYFDIKEPDWDNYDVFAYDLFIEPDRLFEYAIEVKPHIAEANARLNKSMQDVKIAKSGLYPSLTLSAGYGNYYYYNFSSDTFNRDFRTQMRGQGSGNIGFNINIPIFNGFAVRNSIRTAKLQVRSQELELENVKMTVYKEINSAINSAKASQAQYSVSFKAYEIAQETYTFAVESYDVGKSTVLEVNDARNRLLTTNSEQLQAKYDYIFRTKILDFYKGIPIDFNN